MPLPLLLSTLGAAVVPAALAAIAVHRRPALIAPMQAATGSAAVFIAMIGILVTATR